MFDTLKLMLWFWGPPFAFGAVTFGIVVWRIVGGQVDGRWFVVWAALLILVACWGYMMFAPGHVGHDI